MKKLLILLVVLVLAACEQPAYRMDNLDDYIMESSIQKVDVRGQEERIANGYVDYFQVIPLFEYLAVNAIDLSQGYDRFRPSDIKNEALIRALFDEEATAIVIMCNSGARSGYVVAVLEHLGYENVYNLGGYRSYQGAYYIGGQQQ
jgi:rhodanese-related sulfurtransferase